MCTHLLVSACEDVKESQISCHHGGVLGGKERREGRVSLYALEYILNYAPINVVPILKINKIRCSPYSSLNFPASLNIFIIQC